MTDPDTPPAATRRTFLQRGTLAVGGVGFASQDEGTETGTGGARVVQRLIIPTVDTFQGNYEGQFVYVQSPAEGVPDDLPVGDCGYDESWPAEETQAYEIQLLDRFRQQPTAAEVTGYADGRRAHFRSHIHFVVQNTVQCPDGYVGLEIEWLNRRAVIGKSPGPTVTSTDGPGFGLLAAVLGGLGAVGYRALRYPNRDDG